MGYQHGKTYFEGQLSAGNLPVFKATTITNKNESDHILSDYTFTDLAQMVCKVSRPYEDSSSSNSSDDEYEYEDGQSGYASEPTVCLTEVSVKEQIIFVLIIFLLIFFSLVHATAKLARTFFQFFFIILLIW